jgi:Protein of unknown function (DUF3300)
MTTRTQLTAGLSALALALALSPTGVTSAAAQQPPQQQQPASQTLSNQQIEQLVAPIALYPDTLLSQVLMASTYPLEVVEAARWVKENPNVTGQALQDAMLKQPWDPSVKALAAVPQTLQMMSDQLSWTQNLGDAFLAQQADVFNAVQALRARADAAGNLKSTPQQTVTRVNRPAGSPAGAPASAYTIASASPTEYFVPIYDPNVIFGTWPYPAYAPSFWYPPGWGGGWWGFGAGVAVGAAIWGGVNWWNRNVNINVNRYNQFNRTNITNANWRHNPAHRGNVPYRNANVAKQFGGGKAAQRDAARQNLANKGGMGGMGDGGMGGMGDGGMGGMGQGGMGGMGQGGMGGMGQGGMGGMGQGGMGGGGMGGMGMGGGGGMGGMGGGGMAGMGGGHAGMGGGGMMGGGHAGFAGMGGGGMGFAGMGGGARMGGMGGGGRGGRRSDITLKHDIALIGQLDNGIGFYRFAYKGSDTAYVGVMAQDVQRVRPDAVTRGRDGTLRVFYDKLGVKFQTYTQWLADGAQVPAVAPNR